jgi:tetratricopeptide (TPR) repeat protein
LAREIRFFRTDRLSSAAGFFDAAPIPASLTERTVPDPSKRDEAEADAAESTPETSASETTAPTAEPESSDAEPVAANAGEASSSEPFAGKASPESSDDDAPEASSEAESDGEEAATDETVEDDLPEWEPLTPELVEDEAIRGDFMLRWAVVLLALLLGCREIADSASLVRIKTGEYLASNGVLPPANDVFSYTATERPWINTAWLFDLIVGGLYGAGGAVAVSLLMAVIAAATLYFVVHIRRPELPTWWTAFVAGVALIILQIEFTALPEIVTLLGIAWTLRGLMGWSQTGRKADLWCVAGSLAVWSNLDPRAFIGWLILATFAIGTFLGDRLGRRQHHADACLKDLGIATIAGLIALMINPFGWHVLVEPTAFYSGQSPTLGASDLLNVPLYSDRLWQPLSLEVTAGVAVLGVAVLTSLVNLKRLDSGLTFAFLAVSGLAVVCSHELAAAALIGTVLAALNGQDWYRANCRLDYSTDTLELLWSRLGRAATVLALAAFAWLAISGRLMGPDGNRVGVGMSPQLAADISGLQQDLETAGDARIFVTNVRHGDLLIWNDRPTFVDSRLSVYAGGDDDILRLHDQARRALRAADPASAAASAVVSGEDAGPAGEESGWSNPRQSLKELFDRFEIELATPRLWGSSPDVQTWVAMERSPDWTLVSLGGTSAFYARSNQQAGENLAPENTDTPLRTVDFVKLAFRDCRTPDIEVERTDWPRPRTSYQDFLSLPARPASVSAQRARRQADLLSLGLNGGVGLTADESFALAELALRDANAALDDNVNNLYAYQTQASVYQSLSTLESMVLNGFRLPEVNQQRYTQRMLALHQAVLLDPDNLDLRTTLAEEYFSRQRFDLALDGINHSLDLIRNLQNPNDAALAIAQRLSQVKRELEPRVTEVTAKVNEALVAPEPDLRGLIVALAQQGFPLKALELYEEHRLSFAGDLMIELQGAYLYAECGRLDDAETQFAAFEAIEDDPSISFQWVLQSAWLKMAKGEYESAIALCQRRLRDVERSTANAMLSLSSFVQPIPQLLGERQIWPATLTSASSRALYDTQEETTQLRWTVAMAMIEAGLCGDAVNILHELLDADPETRIRPIVALWLGLLTGESVPALPDSDTVPILIEDGPEDPVDAPETVDAANETKTSEL